MTLSIRPAGPDDSSALADVNIASWSAGYAEILPHEVLEELTQGDVEARWSLELDRLQTDPAQVLLAESDGEVVAYARFGPPRDTDSIRAGNVGEIYGFYVHPDHWGIGVGRALIERVLQALRDEGLVDVTLNVVEDNSRARAFYERVGFARDVPAAPWLGVPQLRYRRAL